LLIQIQTIQRIKNEDQICELQSSLASSEEARKKLQEALSKSDAKI
jgi:hypothetical protein